MKKLAAVLLSACLLAGSGAFAADAHRCAKGTHWDPVKMKCVPDTPPP